MKKIKSMRRRNLFMSLTLMFSFLVIAFKFSKEGLEWFWTGMESVPIVLGISAIIFAILWFVVSKSMKKELSDNSLS